MVGGIVQAFLTSGTSAVISAGSKSNSGKTWGSAKIGPLRPPIASSRGRSDITNNNGRGSESFISAKESESTDREQQKEGSPYNERYLKREGESPSMISQARLAASTSARRKLATDAAAVSGASSPWWSGRLVARILPKAFSEYESSKPKWAIDPSSLEGGVIEPTSKVPVLERQGSEGVCSDVLSLAPADQDGCQYDLSGSRGESDLLVTLDVFLFQPSIPSFVNIQRSIHGPGNGSGSGSNSDINSDSGSVGASSTWPDNEEGSSQLLFIHMKREADESALRTLRRLELSTEKKMQTVTHRNGRGKRQNKKRTENLATQNVTSSSSLVVKANPDDEWDNGDMLQKLDLSGLTNAELWRKVAYEYELRPDQRNRVGVSVLNPDVEEDSPDSYIHLDVVCCPPTILSVQIFVSMLTIVFVVYFNIPSQAYGKS